MIYATDINKNLVKTCKNGSVELINNYLLYHKENKVPPPLLAHHLQNQIINS